MWNIKIEEINEQTKPNKNKHVDTENRIAVTRGETWVKGINYIVMMETKFSVVGIGGGQAVGPTEMEI